MFYFSFYPRVATLCLFLALLLTVKCFVGIDYTCDEFMTDDVLLIEFHKRDSLDTFQYTDSLTESALMFTR